MLTRTDLKKILKLSGIEELKKLDIEKNIHKEFILDRIVINDKIVQYFEENIWNKISRDVVVSEAIIRPTGLLDPIITLRPVENQVDDVLEQVRKRTAKGQRVLITTLTKKFAEELDLYLKSFGIKCAYIHSDILTLDRLDILADLRRGHYDVLIGINLLREGLDLPEVSLVAIFDADKEGFLRSRTSLIQIIGRAARHEEGEVIMYGDKITRSMRIAIDETERRRDMQIEYNQKNNITPVSTKREMNTIADQVRDETEALAKISREELVAKEPTLDDLDFESKNKRGGKYRDSKGKRDKNQNKYDANQVLFTNFESNKALEIKEIKSRNLSKDELMKELEIAIDTMNFEKAAAIRDTLK